jgi:methionine salvage enolase-phosphatase E1
MSGGAIDSSFATGAVSGETAGGLAGLSGHPITHSYATGAVSAALYGGGLLGVNEATQALNVSQVYSTGSVAQTGTFGGLIGQDQVHSGNISDAYWDETTSGVTNSSQGAGTPANDPGIAGLSNTQLTSALPTGFDPAIWAQSPSINNGLPYLIANPPR